MQGEKGEQFCAGRVRVVGRSLDGTAASMVKIGTDARAQSGYGYCPLGQPLTGVI
jgi:hypothetical protein